MTIQTAIMFTKGICLTWIPTGTAIVAGLPETGVTQLFGLPVKFWMLIGSASVAGAGGLLAFISTTFGSYMANRTNGNGNGQATTPPVP